ncbi:MAG: metal ABC transporter permease [Candidatus Caldarchaeum sp.]|nr:metal ABC transporter permease [Candidatus Caldarchaeum sp.]
MELVEILLEPFGYEFMRMALLTAVTVGVVASTLSVIVVLRGWSLLGDAISHSVLPGLAAAAALNLPLTLGGAVAGITASLLVGIVESKTRVRNDTAIGIVLTGTFALGLVIISKFRPAVDIFHILFGNVLAVSYEDFLTTVLLSAAVVAFFAALLKEIVAYTFDPIFTSVAGLPSSALHLVLMVMISLAVIAALQTVGIILIIALLITPGATAQLVAKNLRHMFLVAIAVGVASAVVGLYLSFYFAVSSGGTIALTATALFFAVTIFKKMTFSVPRAPQAFR